MSSAWLLLAAGKNRQHGGNDGYKDDPEITYRWDSTVHHHTELAVGDAVVLRDTVTSLGVSVIQKFGLSTEIKPLNKQCLDGVSERVHGLTEFADWPAPAPNKLRANSPFTDWLRVRIQVAPSPRIMSHITKDGHFIHPGSAHMPSFTVYQAAK